MLSAVHNYEQAIEYLYGRINYERAPAESYSAMDFKLDRMRQLLALLGDPQERLPAVHIAGTKGKGSTAVMTAEMLSAAGYRVGLYTSPHISAFEERMTVNGVRPQPEQIVELVNLVAGAVATMDEAPARMNPTYFEIATAMAWLHFLRQGAQLAVLEVGLGGRLDSTNVCRPLVSAITTISRDHTALLGSTLAEIAREKAGIVKPGVPVVSGVGDAEPRSVIEHVCREQGSELFQLGEDIRYRFLTNAPAVIGVRTPWRTWPAVPVPLPGEHQGANAALAVGLVDLLAARGWPVAAEAVPAGMGRVRWPARIEVLRRQPTVVVDAAHNWAAAAALVKTLRRDFPARRRVLVFAGTKDKDLRGLLRQLVPEFDTLVLTQYQNNPRVVPVEELHALAQSVADVPVHLAADPAAAWKLAERLAGPDDLICVTGSFFIAAEIRELLLEQPSVFSDRMQAVP